MKKIIFIQTNDSAIAYRGWLIRREVGRIRIVVNVSDDYYKLEYFRVKQSERLNGVGRRLLNIMIEQIRKVGGSTLIVYPKSEPYEGDEVVEIQDLYTIYEHLGFAMVEREADRNKPNNKMIMTIF